MVRTDPAQRNGYGSDSVDSVVLIGDGNSGYTAISLQVNSAEFRAGFALCCAGRWKLDTPRPTMSRPKRSPQPGADSFKAGWNLPQALCPGCEHLKRH